MLNPSPPGLAGNWSRTTGRATSVTGATRADRASRPTVTVLLTVRNAVETIDACIRSILRQEYDRPVDIVVIDAESDDGTAEILHRLASEHAHVQVISRQCSQPQAFNFAVDEGLLSGEVIALIDGDCVALPGWLDGLVQLLESGWDAAGGVGLTPEGLPLLPRTIGYDLDYRFLNTPEGQVTRHPNMCLAIWRPLLAETKFDESLEVGYDTEFGYRFTSKGHKIGFSKVPRVWHYHRATLKGYAKQQYRSGKFAVSAYLKQPKGLQGDNINPLWMLLQPAIGVAGFGAWVGSFFWGPLEIVAGVAAATLAFLICVVSVRVALFLRRPEPALLLPLLYTLRLPMWIAGVISGTFDTVARAIFGKRRLKNVGAE